MNLTIADLINELSNLGQIHGMDAPARVWNTSKSEIQPLEARTVSGVSSGWCPNSNRQAATLRIAELKGIKPEPAFTLPTPPPGMQWHRLDGWKEGDLPRGWRPHVSNEHDFENDESRDINSRWVKLKDCKFGTSEIDSHRRTTRPLVFTHAGKAWTWHRAGDPMPCMPGNLVELVFADIMQATGSSDGYAQWGLLGPRAIIGWRYASTTREVELGPEDVRCGDEILNARGDRRCITGVFIDGISLAGEGFIKYVDLKPRKIRRRDSDTFEPCSKEVAV